ncbi:putative Fibronectin-binding protein / Fibrinogen-bindingprotein [Candidatus Methylomirabilis oxygeniifera]|uniref:Putative Fibronectin-binding protein / Fibrinogen-bindingprotein n=1 Tax=Methylomirabilis oxygeniifera TaxID=671143 RepID=D5MIM7_METO1|nr:putative Fibronectin-binding protein / Fibrinogen-bindingprotein [Candidatus Methylomirabilis oxyfera]
MLSASAEPAFTGRTPFGIVRVMDAFCLAAIIQELRAVLPGVTIGRALQLDQWSLLLIFHRRQGPDGLLLSVKPGAPSIELLSPPRKPASHSSRFGDLVASKTQGAVIERVEQVGLDRIMAIHMRSGPLPGSTGLTTSEAAMILYVEMLGPASNFFLVDRAAGTVIDRLRAASGRARGETPGPGEPYQPPLDCGRVDPRLVQENEFLELVRLRLTEGVEPARILTTCFTGFSPLMAAELVVRAGLSTLASFDEQAHALWKPFYDFMGRVATAAFEPRLLMGSDGKPLGVAAFPLVTVPDDHQVSYSTMAEACAAYHESREQIERLQTLRAGLLHRLESDVGAAERLMTELEREATLYRDGELHARKGRLLLANRAGIRRGQQMVELVDYADSAQRALQIELDPACSLEENAQHYFALHRKAKRGAQIVGERLAETAKRLRTLQTMMKQVETAKDVGELQRVDAAFACMARRRPIQGPAAPRVRQSEGPEPRIFCSSDGLAILVGKNGAGNDHLTWRLARSHDLWLHAQGIHGSHVLVRLQKGKQAPPRTLCEAAQLAAYYSRARGEAKVPVDYVLRKFLRKPKAAAPGAVLLTQEKTITVQPEAGLVRRLHAAADASRAED